MVNQHDNELLISSQQHKVNCLNEQLSTANKSSKTIPW